MTSAPPLHPTQMVAPWHRTAEMYFGAWCGVWSSESGGGGSQIIALQRRALAPAPHADGRAPPLHPTQIVTPRRWSRPYADGGTALPVPSSLPHDHPTQSTALPRCTSAPGVGGTVFMALGFGGARERERGERDRQEAQLSLCAARAHTPGYVGGM